MYRHISDAGLSVNALLPSQSWDGTAGSGFSSLPVDPVRTTAKPALRLLVPPNQHFADELVVGVAAMATNQGSLLENIGLSHVRAYFEGGVYDISAPSFRTFADSNGNVVNYYGWWVTLKRPSAATGYGNVYFEAVPTDPIMQSRVIGPYLYTMSDAVHDYEVTVASSGADFTSLTSAIDALKNLGAQNPLITITEAGVWQFANDPPNYFTCSGYFHIEASVPVTIGNVSYESDAASVMYCDRAPLWLRGNNITLDYQYMSELYGDASSVTDRNHVLDGVRMANSGGADWMWRGGTYPVGFRVRGEPWLLEVEASDLINVATGSNLVRGGSFTNVMGDIFTSSKCVIGTAIDTHSNDFWNADTPAITFAYNGAGVATVERSGVVNPAAATYTFKVDGSTVGTFACGRDYADLVATAADDAAASPAGVGYWFTDLADFVNGAGAYTGLAGWVAADLGTGRMASSGSLPTLKGLGFDAQNAGGTGSELTVVSMFDLHGDWYQVTHNSDPTNIILFGNRGHLLQGQLLFLSGNNAAEEDFYVVNNALALDPVIGPYYDPTIGASQFTRSNKSGVVVVHNTLPNQRVYFDGAVDFDDYCVFANNSIRSFDWGGTPDADLIFADNHLHGGFIAPQYAIGTTIGGDAASLYSDAMIGDFTPAGDLITNMKAPLIRFDQAFAARGASAAVGAFAIN